MYDAGAYHMQKILQLPTFFNDNYDRPSYWKLPLLIFTRKTHMNPVRPVSRLLC